MDVWRISPLNMTMVPDLWASMRPLPVDQELDGRGPVRVAPRRECIVYAKLMKVTRRILVLPIQRSWNVDTLLLSAHSL
jgi:hypothetical protein